VTTRILSAILIAAAFFFSVRHGWQSLTMSPAEAQAALGLEFSKGVLVGMGALTLSSAVLILFPQTFLAANLIAGISIFYIAALQSSHRNIRGALIEIPFLMLPLVMLYPTIRSNR
jgi:hypothetical protein